MTRAACWVNSCGLSSAALRFVVLCTMAPSVRRVSLIGGDIPVRKVGEVLLQCVERLVEELANDAGIEPLVVRRRAVASGALPPLLFSSFGVRRFTAAFLFRFS